MAPVTRADETPPAKGTETTGDKTSDKAAAIKAIEERAAAEKAAAIKAIDDKASADKAAAEGGTAGSLKAAPPAANKEDADMEEVPPVEKRPARKWVLKPVTKGQRAERIISYVLIGGAGVLAVGGLIALGYRQHYAALWNDDSRCLVNNQTRFQNCASDFSNANLAETHEWELLLGAGALATVATGLFVASLPERQRERRRAEWRLSPGPGSVGLGVAVRF